MEHQIIKCFCHYFLSKGAFWGWRGWGVGSNGCKLLLLLSLSHWELRTISISGFLMWNMNTWRSSKQAGMGTERSCVFLNQDATWSVLAVVLELKLAVAHQHTAVNSLEVSRLDVKATIGQSYTQWPLKHWQMLQTIADELRGYSPRRMKLSCCDSCMKVNRKKYQSQLPNWVWLVELTSGKAQYVF